MNKPIRNLGRLLHAAVRGAARQRDLPAVLAGRRPLLAQRPPRQPAGARRCSSRASAARSSCRARRSRRARSPRTATSSSASTRQARSTPSSPATSHVTSGSAAIEATQNSILSGSDSAAVRQPGDRPRRQRRPQGRQRHRHHQPRRRRRRRSTACGARHQRQGRRGRDRAAHRQDPGDGLQPDLRPQQAGQPRLRGRGAHQGPAPDARPTSRCTTARSRRRCRPGSTFKLVTAAAALDSPASSTPTRRCPAARILDAAPDGRPTPQRERLAPAAATRSRSPGRSRSPATWRSAGVGLKVGEDGHARHSPRSSASATGTSPTSTTP